MLKKRDFPKTVVDITPSSVAKSALVVLLMLLLVYFLWQISNILVIFFVAFLLAAALDPLIDQLQARKIPRSLAVVAIYIIALVLIGIVITNLVDIIASQVSEIATKIGDFVTSLTNDGGNFPYETQIRPYLEQFYHTVDLQTAASQFQSALTLISTQLLNISFGLVNLLLVLILTFFMTVEEKAIQDFFLSLFPSRHALYISSRLEAVKDQIGHWMRGQILVSIISAILTYICLVILGVEYALTLSVIAGLCMVVPLIGRVFAWIIAFPIVFNQSPLLSLWVTVLYFGLQQIEVNIIVPYIMQKVVGISPIIVIFALMVSYQYLGILGLVLSIPVATSVSIFVKDYASKAK